MYCVERAGSRQAFMIMLARLVSVPPRPVLYLTRAIQAEVEATVGSAVGGTVGRGGVHGAVREDEHKGRARAVHAREVRLREAPLRVVAREPAVRVVCVEHEDVREAHLDATCPISTG